MARKTTGTTSSKTRKKTGTATPKLDAALLFMTQYPLAQLCEIRVQQLEDRLKAATEENAAVPAGLAAELDQERQVLEHAHRLQALGEEIQSLMKSGDGDKAAEEKKAQRADELHREWRRSEIELASLAREGSVLANYILGASLLKDVLSPGTRSTDGDGKKAERDKLQQAAAFLGKAAERGYSPAYFELHVVHEHLGDSAAADQWFARALEAGEPPALLKDGEILVKPVPLPADELQAHLDRLWELALSHCWGALELLCIVCKMRRENEVVRSFEQKTLRLVQDLARQGLELAMLTLGNYYDTILLAPDARYRDKKVHYWYDMAAEHGNPIGLVRSVRAGFFGPAYTGPAHMAIARVMAERASDLVSATELSGVLGSLLRPVNVPDELAEQSDDLLLSAALGGFSHYLCRTLRAEIIWDDDVVERGYPDETLLDDARLDKDPLVLFTRGQTMLNYPGQHGQDFVQRALDNILTAVTQGNPAALGWLTDAALRGLYGVRQNIEAGLKQLKTGLAIRHPRAMALEALRLLGWIRGIPGDDHADRAWIRELLGMAASDDDCLGFAALVLLEALEPAPAKRQKELGADLGKAIIWARSHADASAHFLIGCVACLHADNPGLNEVCRHYSVLVGRKTGDRMYQSEYAAHVATSSFHSAGLLGEPKAELLASLVQPELDNLPRLREEGKSLEDFM